MHLHHSSRLSWAWLMLCAWLLCSFHRVSEASASGAQANGYEVMDRIKEGDSTVAVVRQQGVLFLLYDETIIGAEFDDPWLRLQAAFPGFAIMQASRYLNRDLHRALQIGLGIGTVPSFLRREGLPTDAVELSEAVVRQAAQYFQYDWCPEASSMTSECDSGRTFVTDGLKFIDNAPEKQYDLVIVDVYTGWNPLLFFVQEVMQTIKTRLLSSSDGVLVMNFVGYHNGPYAIVPRSIKRTLRSVFHHVQVYREVRDATDEEACNIVFFASDSALEFNLPRDGLYADPDPATYYDVITHFPDWEVFTDDEHDQYGARILTRSDHGQEDFAEIHKATESHMRERVLERFPSSLWKELQVTTATKDEL